MSTITVNGTLFRVCTTQPYFNPSFVFGRQFGVLSLKERNSNVVYPAVDAEGNIPIIVGRDYTLVSFGEEHQPKAQDHQKQKANEDRKQTKTSQEKRKETQPSPKSVANVTAPSGNKPALTLEAPVQNTVTATLPTKVDAAERPNITAAATSTIQAPLPLPVEQKKKREPVKRAASVASDDTDDVPIAQRKVAAPTKLSQPSPTAKKAKTEKAHAPPQQVPALVASQEKHSAAPKQPAPAIAAGTPVVIEKRKQRPPHSSDSDSD